MRGGRALAARLRRPGWAGRLALLLVCAPALFYVFWAGLDRALPAYPVYVLSAYALGVWVVWGVGAAKGLRAAVYAHPLGRRYLTDLPFRGRLSLWGGTAVNACYAVFEVCCALVLGSFWFGALGMYYLLLAAARGLLLHSLYRRGEGRAEQLRAARRCAWLLLGLNFALTAVTAQMVLAGRGYAYPGTLIFVMAFYAFYSVGAAVVNLVRFRRLESPVLSASKVVGLATALVSMLSLQTAMFAAFGGDFAYRRLMNLLTGTGVCLALFLMAVLMLARTTGALRRLKLTN